MKKLMNIMKEKAEYVWMGGEFFLIYIAWGLTGNLPFILGIKIFSILFSEQIFHEEIEGRFKRVLWQLLSFIAYVVAFALTHTGYEAYGIFLTLYVASMGAVLLHTGKFHNFSSKEQF
ncbi:hypothetical protein CVD28_02035 [Bacillus sp. M6-12]|uniref:hypothetical protein n=1 Tax=Bacillus sp. M6-12 TaxID=2054166 RepID=UPI000C7726B1|nr:hypothetical protein [Bacillus sp. M6-12]PLS19212.1 hypothetical protein CVD28_02035 [Bacillus sp. M6-12]